MSNVYRAPVEKSEPKPRIELVPGDAMAEANSTLELAAANVNVMLGTGFRNVNKYGKRVHGKGKRGEGETYRQPFWFVYERGETVVVYAEAEMLRTYDGDGKLLVSFDLATPREQLRVMLINWHAARHFTSLVRFGGGRDFTIKYSRAR
jgi:hypothetical protein